MAVYSIRDLEKLSGIKAHTIRIWEKRYQIIEPKRTPTNIRYYYDEDLKLLLNIAMLNRNGYRISKIAAMEEEKIAKKAAELSNLQMENENQLDALTMAMIELDEMKFNRIIDLNVEELGFEETMLDVIYPLLDKLSVLYMAGSIKPVQENFMSLMIRQKIIAAIDSEPAVDGDQNDSFLLYLPEGESQEMSLLFLHYLIKSRGMKVINVGTELSLKELKDAFDIHSPDYVFTLFDESDQNGDLQSYIEDMADTFDTCTILLSGMQVAMQNLVAPDNVKFLTNMDETLEFLSSITKPGESIQH